MKRKVLLLQHEISQYNAPIYELINENVDLTVGFFRGDKGPREPSYKRVKLESYNISRFIFIRHLKRLCWDFNAVIFDPNPMCLSFYCLPYGKRKYKAIPWTVGVRASYHRRYTLPFEKKGLYYHLMDCMFRHSDAIVFYMGEPISCWITKKLPKEKFFVAHNTLKIADKPIDWDHERTSILFVGALYKEKKVEELIRAYLEVVDEQSDRTKLPTLDIVGDGDQRVFLQDMVQQSGHASSIHFHGAIFDENILQPMFADALVCISPNQAGLSVLKSMGYGVPFATQADAITGGERLNIRHQENGFLYNSYKELKDIIRLTLLHPERFTEMGRKAHDFYLKYATPEIMAQGFLDAVDYAFKQQ